MEDKQCKIHVTNLKKNFGKLEVLKDISVDVQEGEVVVLLGPSGSGKSTLLRCLNQLETATSGKIIIDGHDVTDKHTDINKVRENIGMVFQHFGHTEQFKLYEVADGKIVREEVVDTNGSGHGALAGFLMQRGVDTLICGGIGGGAQMALAEAGIKLYGGVSGEADAAVNALLASALAYDPNVRCDHHDHAHGEGGHTCGHHGCH